MSSPLKLPTLLLCARLQRHNRIRAQSIRLLSERKPRHRKGSESLIFPGIITITLGLGAYAFYQHCHDAMTMWPPQLRQNLRQGLYAKRKGDSGTALSYLSKAWEDTKSIPLDALGDDPLLKLSGVAITLAGTFEDARLDGQAYRIYKEGLFHMINRPSDSVLNLTVDSLNTRLSAPEDKIRAICITYKLGELANRLKRPLAEEEKWLNFCVETLVTILPEALGRRSVEFRKKLEEFGLPSWTMLNDFAAPFEALGGFYAKTGRSDYAEILYMQAITLLLSDSHRSSAVEDKCRGAQLMGNLAELSLRGHPSDEVPQKVLAHAEIRVKEALELTRAARKKSGFSRNDVCEEVYAVLLYNFAMLRKFAGDVDTAKEHFLQSLQQAKAIKMEEGIANAETALSNLESAK